MIFLLKCVSRILGLLALPTHNNAALLLYCAPVAMLPLLRSYRECALLKETIRIHAVQPPLCCAAPWCSVGARKTGETYRSIKSINEVWTNYRNLHVYVCTLAASHQSESHCVTRWLPAARALTMSMSRRWPRLHFRGQEVRTAACHSRRLQSATPEESAFPSTL